MRDLDKQDFPVTKKLLKDKQPISVPPLYKAFSLSLSLSFSVAVPSLLTHTRDQQLFQNNILLLCTFYKLLCGDL